MLLEFYYAEENQKTVYLVKMLISISNIIKYRLVVPTPSLYMIKTSP